MYTFNQPNLTNMKLTYYAKQCFALFFFIKMAVIAQDRSIQGTVTDDAGVPLPGATVVILETNQGTTTGLKTRRFKSFEAVGE